MGRNLSRVVRGRLRSGRDTVLEPTHEAAGLIDTPWTADWHALRARIEDTAPLRRSGTPQHVADACVGLIGASYATGQVLVVDGGVALR